MEVVIDRGNLWVLLPLPIPLPGKTCTHGHGYRFGWVCCRLGLIPVPSG